MMPRIKTKNKGMQVKNPNVEKIFPIVGIGASAGGFEALHEFLSATPEKTNMAFIIITHSPSNHVSSMDEIIRKYTIIPINIITDGMKVEPNNIYLVPPGKNIFLEANKLYFVEQSIPFYTNQPINIFFKSLGLERKGNAIVVILSGMGADGSLALEEVKSGKGLVIVQEPTTAQYDSMPRRAISTGEVDYILPANEIPDQILKWLKNREFQDDLHPIYNLLLKHTHHDFSTYKSNTIRRRIERKMNENHIETLADFADYLNEQPHEIDELLKSILIGVTSFFRDAECFNQLKKDIFPLIFKNKPDDYCFRIWIPGCSIGKEVYSIAILFCEYMREIKRSYQVQIFASDIDAHALNIARQAIYPESIQDEVTPERLEKFFVKLNHEYKVKQEIRNMIIFGVQDISRDPSFTKVDMICCRNLLFYLDNNLQKRILSIFHYSLKPDGVLFLGTSESIGALDLFVPIIKNAKIYIRNNSAPVSKHILSFSGPGSYKKPLAVSQSKNANLQNDIINSIKQCLFLEYTQPCIAVNFNGNIIYAHEKIMHYFPKSQLNFNYNFFKMLPPELRVRLTKSFQKAILDQKETVCKNIQIKGAEITYNLNIKIIPMPNYTTMPGIFLLVFENVIKKRQLALIDKKYGSTFKMHTQIIKLEQELQETRFHLQESIEELQAGNEELLSTNEELQSTNEEIETSKEELQSVNEELVTVNHELQNRIEELALAKDDMSNLFDRLDIAAILLNNHLCIKRFTLKTQELIELIKSDIGRPIKNFTSSLLYDNFMKDIQFVADNHIEKNVEVQSNNDRWYSVRILPYQTISVEIEGIIILFNDITANIKVHEVTERNLIELNTALESMLVYTENLMDKVNISLVVLNDEYQIVSANRSFENFGNLNPECYKGKSFFAVAKQFNYPELKQSLDNIFEKNNPLENYHMNYSSSKNSQRTITINANKMGQKLMLLSIES